MSAIDPVCDQSAPGTYWTTTNIAEGLPGVLSPLTWSVWGPNMERSTRRAMVRLGIFPRQELSSDVPVDQRFGAIFYGRAALNVDTYRRVADLTPGMEAASAEAQLLGSARAGEQSASTWRRLPSVLARLPVVVGREPRRLRAFVAAQREWWWRQVRPAASAIPAEARLQAAARRLDLALEHHCIGSMLSLALFGQVASLARNAGLEGLESQLVTGYGGLEEFDAVADLWALAREEITVEQVIARHGFHGPGELREHSWREQPEALTELVASYRSLPPGADPVSVAGRQAATRTDAEAVLLAKSRRTRRPVVRFALRRAASLIPLRESGKAAFLMALDAARSAAREIGGRLAEQGVLIDPEDAFFLTMEELTRLPADAAALAAERRDRDRYYQTLELPRSWAGQPVTTTQAVSRLEREASTSVSGVGVSPGVVEGRARVARSIDEARRLEPGEVLVCHTTDPSWASVFPLVGALAIDVGGTASHGAIVAREFGIPCVINTMRGTDVFVTGDLLRLDGALGTVERVVATA